MGEGGCQCGAIRFQNASTEGALYVCHCKECQKQSASAFGISLVIDAAALTVTKGEPQVWTRNADSGRQVRCYFCPTCGSRLWHEPAEDPVTVRIKGGALDEPPDLSKAIHIWTDRRLAGVVLPEGVQTFPGEPP